MVTHAYNELYLPDAKQTLAIMFDYAVNYKMENIDNIFIQFITSGIAYEFEKGNPMFIVGKTGIDIYNDIKYILQKQTPQIIPYISCNRTPEYWLGDYLAYAQWYLNIPFNEIAYALPISQFLGLYNPYHETDPVYVAQKIYNIVLTRNNSLRDIRKFNNFSQSELANLSGVDLRSIQMFEQGRNDINKAQFKTIQSLAHQLNCNEMDLSLGINFKLKLLEENRRKNEEYIITLQNNNQNNINLFNQQINGYINQFPYNYVGYYNNDYYFNKEYIINNFINYWHNCNTTQPLKRLESIANGIGYSTNNKNFNIFADCIGVINAQNIIEASYKVFSLLNNLLN